jgi:hypothetical protein
MTRKLTRIQSLLAGGAFALAGIGGASAAALSGGHTAAAAETTTTTTAVAASAPAPSEQDLHPIAVSEAQKTFTPDRDQLANTKAIVDAAKDLNLPPRAWEIAVATSLQEANLHNIGDLGAKNDHDSLGLFQQRTGTGGWGSAAEIQDPHHATQAFLNRLVKIDGWDSMPLTKAAQKVQVSAYPQAYAKHEQQAADMINALYGAGPHAQTATNL